MCPLSFYTTQPHYFRKTEAKYSPPICIKNGKTCELRGETAKEISKRDRLGASVKIFVSFVLVSSACSL